VKAKAKPSQYEINHFIMMSYIMQWKVKVKASQYDTKDCNCFITLNENESETKSMQVLIKQYQILRNIR
jgi:hypothetical protein